MKTILLLISAVIVVMCVISIIGNKLSSYNNMVRDEETH